MRTNDDSTSRGLAWCLAGVVGSLVVPGSGHLLIRADTRRARVLVPTLISMAATATLLGALYGNGSNRTIPELVADRGRFVAIDVALVLLAITRLWAAADTAWQARPRSGVSRSIAAATLSSVLVVAGVAPLAVAADYVWRTDRAVESVFGADDPEVAVPGAVETTSTTSIVAPTATSAATTSTTLVPFAGDDRVNVLLLGGDAGKGRWSLRTDTMVVISINPDTGDTVMISVPRNLTKIQFPPDTALAERFPHGFTDLANAVYPWVNSHRDIMGGGDDAGAQAIKLGIAQLLGVPIQYYVLVDMRGFIDVVDALGGIDVNVTKRVPAPGDPQEANHISPAYFEVGRQHFDGTLALSYSRSRKADSDYQRMERQRCVLLGVASAATPRALASGLGDLMDAFGNAVRTDIPRDRIGELVQLVERYSAAGGAAALRTLILTPPTINPANWKADKVRALVTAVLTPPTATPPSTDPDGPTTTTGGTLPPDVLQAECN